jgi:hypothetical protein
VLVHTLMELDPRFPTVDKQRRQELLAVREMLEAQAPKGAPPDPFAQERASEGRARGSARADADVAAQADEARGAEEPDADG